MKRQGMSYTNAYSGRTEIYIEGNTVRKRNPMPQRDVREERIKEENRRAQQAARNNRERAMQMSPGYLVFLTIAVIMTVLVCGCYIQLQSEINGRMRNIASLEKQILELQAENDAAVKRIETSVNLEEVKEAAVAELGMVYPKESQIVYFTVETDDFMNQYQNIPE